MVSVSRLSLIKFLELAVVIILLILHCYSDDVGFQQHIRFLTMGTIGGYLIILVGLFAGGLMSTPVNRRVDLFYSVIGCALFMVIGILNINAFSNIFGFSKSHKDTGIAKGSMAIVEGVLFLFDAFLTFRGEA
ncbi:uncharacterized protein LOC127287745 [Leptopilina boulardi]|uniref:uncharacterized protein LOC127287745 n=1 Tax=Leptopilina boulardi TaxID=63433 RepID=UPI0021F6471B|nr:uncharacterized protein LOC127287745 [Leptopilina boulardi]